MLTATLDALALHDLALAAVLEPLTTALQALARDRMTRGVERRALALEAVAALDVALDADFGPLAADALALALAS